MDGKRGTTPGMKLPSRKSLQRSWLSAPRSLPALRANRVSGHPCRCVVTSRSQARLDPTALVSGRQAPRGVALIKVPRGRRPFSEFVPSPSGELTSENSDDSR
ncbi:hypothetical protein ALC62_12944 [Cyphomyrmex costatus]|uniref:Uncharacterized protein n=1 Tax=Cyphomyrmex costatus TaxID=456900 RepID=A0A195C6G9_9HYME|nr:hypothetical protein ALC62_12944 [Cyphomyrmex costatus]